MMKVVVHDEQPDNQQPRKDTAGQFYKPWKARATNCNGSSKQG